MAAQKKMTKTAQRGYVAMACVVGANELARMAKSVGDAIWWRELRATFVREALKHGVTLENGDELQTIRVDSPMPTANEAMMFAAAAASERAAIVAMLERVARQYDDLHGNDEANALYAIAEEIIRLDHHREPGKETT